MKFFYGFIFSVLFSTALSSQAGELIYRAGELGQNCSWQLNNGANDTLLCSGVPTLKRAILQIGGSKGCALTLVNMGDAAFYEDAGPVVGGGLGPGVYRCPDAIISRKSYSGRNVFSSRPLDKNYLAYSIDGNLDRPVILVEGYDPDNVNTPAYYYNRGFNRLVFSGRDLFIVNFPNGSASLNENAALLQSIIQEINGAKFGTYPMAVIGYSMGGVIARKALKNMELAGINHQTSLYVSYDAPHGGANFPVAIEDTINGLVRTLDNYTAGYTTASLKRAQNYYKSPAARGMLIPISGPNADFQLITAADFPNIPVRVGITSGSMAGANGLQSNSVSLGEYVAGFRFYLYKSSLGSLSDSFQWYSKHRGIGYYDNAPGSYDKQFLKAYLKLKDSADSFEVWNAAADKNITFVPTMSALAMYDGVFYPAKDYFRTRSPFDKYIAADDSTDGCAVFRAQTSLGKNILHDPGDDSFNDSQLSQLVCALTDYHDKGVTAPDRSFKTY